MAIEWHSRVNRTFTLRDALDLTGVRLAGLLGWPDARGRVEAREATLSRRRGGPSGPVEESVLGLRIDPDRAEPPQPDVYFEVPDWDAAVLVSISQFQPETEDPEDPETGLFAWVTAKRTPASKVVGIAAIIALAECAGGKVVDEYGYLSDARLNKPAELYERLRVPAPQDSLDDAVEAVLAGTGLRSTRPN
ncbi:hypothetical protein ACFHW0_17715 [Micromonospora sp. LOL_025]|uniref:hypothetical protein n=1 Tax=Micromonospora sp. LOL_025 TaxID=3345413 RepID=UPI003A8B284C